MNFDIESEIGIAIIAASSIVINIVMRFVEESWVICEIAKAAPVLDFWKRKSVTNEIDMMIVLTEPRRIRNCSRFSLPVTSDPIIAAWLEPSPGKNEQIGETIIVARVGLISSDLRIPSLSIFCSGIIVLDFIEWTIVEVPKRPVSRGSIGCLIGKFRAASPRKPANMKMRIAFVLDSFSLYIKNIDIQIRKNAIMRWRNGNIVGIKNMKIGIIRIREMTAMVEPIRVSFSAW